MGNSLLVVRGISHKYIVVDEELYFEGKFDKEALLTMMTKKVLEPIGFDCGHIFIQYAERAPLMSEVNEEEQGMDMAQSYGTKNVDK